MLKQLREIDLLRRENPSVTSFMRDRAARSGVGQAAIQEWWALDRIAPILVCAVVKAEDFGFFRHRGVAWQATLGASLAAIRGTPNAGGASTITQQLARNLFLKPERKVSRKLREIALAVAMDRSLGKPRILELYLNTVEWGEGVWGCAGATRHYFGKTPAQVDTFAAVALAALLPAPRRALAGANLNRAIAAQKRVAWQLYVSGIIEKTELIDCLRKVVRLREQLEQGQPLRNALAGDGGPDAVETRDRLAVPSREIAEPLRPEQAVAQGCGLARERFELIALRRRIGPKAWRESIVSGDFFRLD